MTPEILNIIHLPSRLDRRQSFMEECNRQNIAYNVWDGVTDHKDPIVNINIAHKAIVQYAKSKELPYVRIAEDDVKFFDTGAWKYYLQNEPKDFHFYTGVIYYGDFEGSRITTKDKMSGTLTLYTIHSSFYDTFLSTDNSKNLDRALGQFALSHNFYVCMPMVCYQMNGYSDHFRRRMIFRISGVTRLPPFFVFFQTTLCDP